MNDLFISGFLKTLRILNDYLSVIVIGGGWAPFIYYRYLLGDKAHEPIRTRPGSKHLSKTLAFILNLQVPKVFCVWQNNVHHLLFQG